MAMNHRFRGCMAALLLLATSAAQAAAELQLDKQVDVSRPNTGDTVQYSLTVTNTGDTDAAGAQVTDLLPPQVAYVSDDEPDGKYNASSGLWDIGTLAPSASKTLRIVALVN